MKIKTAVITVVIFGVLVVTAAYIQRGYWAVGAEWLLPIIAAAVVSLEEGEENEKRNSPND